MSDDHIEMTETTPLQFVLPLVGGCFSVDRHYFNHPGCVLGQVQSMRFVPPAILRVPWAKFGNKAMCAPRIAQGYQTLISHALSGIRQCLLAAVILP